MAQFAVAGWSEWLSRELARLGIKATTVRSGKLRTDFIDASSVSHGDIVALANAAEPPARFAVGTNSIDALKLCAEELTS